MRRTRVSSSPRALWLAALALLPLAGPALAAGDGTLLERRESPYNTISILESGDYVTMRFTRNRKWGNESRMNRADELEIPLLYSRHLTIGAAYARHLDSMLMVGLGGGRASWYLHRYVPAMRITVVELDPEVVALAANYFQVHPEPNFEIVVDDGRAHLMKDARQYDLIVLDAHRADYVPFHLFTVEFYRLVKSRLRPGGAVVQNLDPRFKLFDSTVQTMRQVFDNFGFLPADGNLVVVAYDGPAMAPHELYANARRMQTRYGFRYPVDDMLDLRVAFEPQANARVLTDDFAPVETLNVIERNNLSPKPK